MDKLKKHNEYCLRIKHQVLKALARMEHLRCEFGDLGLPDATLSAKDGATTWSVHSHYPDHLFHATSKRSILNLFDDAGMVWDSCEALSLDICAGIQGQPQTFRRKASFDILPNPSDLYSTLYTNGEKYGNIQLLGTTERPFKNIDQILVYQERALRNVEGVSKGIHRVAKLMFDGYEFPKDLAPESLLR